MKTAPPKEFGGKVVKELPWFKRKNRLNFRFRPKNPSQFRYRSFSFFLEITCFWVEKPFQVPISAEKSVSILVKIFFFGDHLFLGGKTISISNFGQKIRLIISNKSFESDSKAIKTRVKVAYSCLTLSKNAWSHLSQLSYGNGFETFARIWFISLLIGLCFPQ